MNAVLTIFFWALTYAVIVFYGFRYWKEHPVLMPLVSGSLISAAVIGPIVLVLNCVYVYYCFIDRDFRLPVNTKTEEGTR